MPEGRALLDGSGVLNEPDGAQNGKSTKSKKPKKSKSISDAKTPKETVRRFQKSVNKRNRHKDAKNVGGVCSKIL